jgi:hypothetical protein
MSVQIRQGERSPNRFGGKAKNAEPPDCGIYGITVHESLHQLKAGTRKRTELAGTDSRPWTCGQCLFDLRQIIASIAVELFDGQIADLMGGSALGGFCQSFYPSSKPL